METILADGRTIPLKTVLIADDQPGIRRLINATILSDEYAVVEAVDGNQAWALIQSCRPNVALLDVQMPGQSGLELTRAVRKDESLAGTQIILLTARSGDADIAAGLSAGADHYLTKPFSPLQLLTILEKALKLA